VSATPPSKDRGREDGPFAALQRRLFENLSEALALHEYIYDVSGVPIDYRYLEVNPAYEELTGIRAEDIVGRTKLELDPETGEQWVQRYLPVAMDGVNIQFEDYSQTLDKYFEVHAYSPQLGQFATLASDITERKRAEQAMRNAEKRFRVLFDQDPDGIVIIDPATARVVEFNESAHLHLGYTREEFAELGIADIEALETPDDTRATIDTVMAEGHLDFDTRQRTKTGEMRNVHVTAHLVDIGGQTVYHCIWRDVTDRTRDREQLALTLSMTESILESVDSGILVVGRGGEVLRTNRKFAELWRVPDEALAAKDDAVLLSHVLGQLSDPDGFLERVTRLYNEFEVEDFGEIAFKDGRVFERGSRPVVISGELIGRVWSFRDVTGRKLTEAELDRYRHDLERLVDERTADLLETNEELRRANAAKSAFLASMSHELRTPLNSIIGFSGIMSQGLAGPLTDEQKVQVGMVNRSGLFLLSLVDKVLDLATIEAGVVEIVAEPVDAAALLSDVVDAVSPAAREKGLELSFEAEAGGGSLTSDPGKVRQILFNLVGNAVKFTESGGVAVALRRLPAGEFAFEVTDTGHGIAADDLSRVFEAFTQLRVHGVAKSKGTGLGLRISREFAHLLGGEITVASEVGVGSTFTLVLPEVPASS
jgi:PAS domain S-box-containing protein